MLELIDLTKKYSDKIVVDGLSLKARQGEIVGLLGPNGAGKSTTVSIISTILAPDSGEIWVDQQLLKPSSCEVRRIMGIVPQELALYEALSAMDNLEFFGTLYGMSGNVLKDRAREVLELMGLYDKRHQSIQEFSGGMKRRINMGIALMHNPKLLILDEPTVGIDPQSRNHILETVKGLKREFGTTVIYTTHYMEEVEYLCDRVAIMDHGKLIAYGTKEELQKSSEALDTLTLAFQPTGQEYTEDAAQIPGIAKITMDKNEMSLLVDPKEGNVIEILDQLRYLGIQLTSFQYEKVNLEQVFLQLTGKSLRD
ncbi:ABC transporter ATP-binding protein [Paenibacillus sp. SN-8-1]|uniref:ABC transporter ATP-binding protein n=1 Tax=Paenibacillus sp. SN-8-1 TaxID=3435409 RepID=UPI003D9A7BAC